MGQGSHQFVRPSSHLPKAGGPPPRTAWTAWTGNQPNKRPTTAGPAGPAGSSGSRRTTIARPLVSRGRVPGHSTAGGSSSSQSRQETTVGGRRPGPVQRPTTAAPRMKTTNPWIVPKIPVASIAATLANRRSNQSKTDLNLIHNAIHHSQTVNGKSPRYLNARDAIELLIQQRINRIKTNPLTLSIPTQNSMNINPVHKNTLAFYDTPTIGVSGIVRIPDKYKIIHKFFSQNRRVISNNKLNKVLQQIDTIKVLEEYKTIPCQYDFANDTLTVYKTNLNGKRMVPANQNRTTKISEMLLKLPNVKHLNLSHCGLTHTPDLKHMTELQTCDLSDNHLTTLPVEPFFNKLQELNVRNNKLFWLPQYLFETGRITKLYATHNAIQVIPHKKPDTMNVASITHNPLKEIHVSLYPTTFQPEMFQITRNGRSVPGVISNIPNNMTIPNRRARISKKIIKEWEHEEQQRTNVIKDPPLPLNIIEKLENIVTRNNTSNMRLVNKKIKNESQNARTGNA